MLENPLQDLETIRDAVKGHALLAREIAEVGERKRRKVADRDRIAAGAADVGRERVQRGKIDEALGLRQVAGDLDKVRRRGLLRAALAFETVATVVPATAITTAAAVSAVAAMMTAAALLELAAAVTATLLGLTAAGRLLATLPLRLLAEELGLLLLKFELLPVLAAETLAGRKTTGLLLLAALPGRLGTGLASGRWRGLGRKRFARRLHLGRLLAEAFGRRRGRFVGRKGQHFLLRGRAELRFRRRCGRALDPRLGHRHGRRFGCGRGLDRRRRFFG